MGPSIETLVEMGWYLDTSLFKDFIQKNIRRGFDNAEKHDGKTVLHVRASGTRKQVFVFRL